MDGHPRIKVLNTKIKSYGRLKEQFINGINDKAVTSQIMKETTFKNTSEQVLSWARRIELQIVQKAMLDSIQQSK